MMEGTDNVDGDIGSPSLNGRHSDASVTAEQRTANCTYSVRSIVAADLLQRLLFATYCVVYYVGSVKHFSESSKE